MHAVDLGTGRTLFAPGAQFRNGQGGALRLNFHRAVAQVANPSTHAEVQGTSVAAGSEPHALHPPMNQQAPAFDEGLMADRLGAADKPSFKCIGAVAIASRHREQIVEQLAQCR